MTIGCAGALARAPAARSSLPLARSRRPLSPLPALSPSPPPPQLVNFSRQLHCEIDGAPAAACGGVDAKFPPDAAGNGSFVSSVLSYWFLLDIARTPTIAASFASAAHGATFVSVCYDERRDARVDDLVGWLPKRAKQLAPVGVRTGVCGVDAFKVAISAGVEQNLAQMDVIVLPLALLILGLIIRNPGLMIVPVCTIVATLMVEDLVM